MQIDCYGFEATSQFFKRKELDAHLMKRIDGVLYVCFGGEAERPIAPPWGPPRRGGSRFARRFPSKTRRNTAAFSSAHSRLDKDDHGSVRLMWAYGKWEDAESLRYIPINQTMEIKDPEDK